MKKNELANNQIEIDINGKKERFNILLRVDMKDNLGTYILYTNNEKNDVGDIIVYAGLLENNGEDVLIKPVNDEEKLELLSDLLSKVDKEGKNKEEEK